MSHRNKKHAKTSSQSIRIIAGQWRSRVLSFPEIEGLRPTGNRIRETLFNWLQDSVYQAKVLDLFSGSGALAFEALSRGAAEAVLLETNANAIKQLKENSALLSAQNAQIEQRDATAFLNEKAEKHFDLVFIDPPFAANLWECVFNLLENNAWLSENALIYVEMPKQQAISVPQNWSLHKEKSGGNVSYRLYQRSEPSSI